MKSLVTMRIESVARIGVPSARARLLTTGVVPEQLKLINSPDTCGNRPVAIAGLQTGLNPFSNAAVSTSPVIVAMTVRLPNGNTANTSPHVTSPTASPADGGLI